jgi:hypothetical protein
MHMSKPWALLLSVALAAVPLRAVAQSSPEAVAVAYVAAIKSGGFSASADFIHPDELQRFKSMFAPLLADPKSPAAQGFAQAMFGPQATAESVAALDPLSFMRGVMSFLEDQMQGFDMTIGDVQVLGAVPENDTVHLVTRNTAGAAGVQLTQLEVMSLKPYQNTWKLLLSGQLEGLAQALNRTPTPSPDEAAGQ